jgi:murein DD-endopeptidase
MPRAKLHSHALIAATCLALLGSGICSSEEQATAFKKAAIDTAVTHPAVAVAKRMLGMPYHYGGASPQRGFDCSGLVYYSFKQAGINAPRTTQTLYRNAFAVEPTALRQGDLLFFRIDGKISHVGLYVGGNVFVHAPSSGKVVSYASLDTPYWHERLIKAGRLF